MTTTSEYMNKINNILKESVTSKQLLSKLIEYDHTLAHARIRYALKNYMVNHTTSKEQSKVLNDTLKVLEQ